MTTQSPASVDRADAMDIARRYLTRAITDPAMRDALLAQIATQQPANAAEAMHLTQAALAAHAPDPRSGTASAQARVHSGFAKLHPLRPGGDYRGASMPPLARSRMSPPSMDRRPWRFLDRLFRHRRRKPLPPRRPRPQRGPLRRRHLLLALLVALPAAGATTYMATVLPHRGSTPLELLILVAGFMLFGWILIGFWTATFGYGVLTRGGRYRIGSEGGPEQDPGPARTAVVMPICEEDVTRAFAGLQAAYESIRATGRLQEFDFFVLSDSSNPDTIVAEQQVWARTCHALDGFGRLFYRRRRARVKRKSGNLADFCRRWGADYRYMIVFDADSIMTGSTMITLVDRMQANPNVGLVQTPPVAVNRNSLLARVQQFATHAYGRMFAAGLHFWHLDNSHYWGHNAVIRIEPFMAHCALPRLPGRGALSGEIMSHDFVEAALLSRAGWGVFIAYDLDGSYEEVPPTLLEELQRDRRWCRGNIQHSRLLFSDHLQLAHRALFANGIMAYTSAVIWFVFLLLSSSEAVLEAIRVPDYFPEPGSLFPAWPQWEPIWAISLFALTMTVLFLPKILGIFLIARHGRQHAYGGLGRLVLSTVIEIVLTTLLAPIRMITHSWFVVSTILGKRSGWGSQARSDEQVPWAHALRYHLPGMVLAAAWGGTLLYFTPGFAPWVAPIIIPLLIAPAITVFTSRVDAGLWLRRHRLQLIPEETREPPILQRVRQITATAPADAGFAAAIVDPLTNALHVALQGQPRRLAPELGTTRAELAQRALTEGPQALNATQRRQLLADPLQMQQLHQRVWSQQPAVWSRWLKTPGVDLEQHC